MIYTVVITINSIGNPNELQESMNRVLVREINSGSAYLYSEVIQAVNSPSLSTRHSMQSCSGTISVGGGLQKFNFDFPVVEISGGGYFTTSALIMFFNKEERQDKGSVLREPPTTGPLGVPDIRPSFPMKS